MPVNTTLGPEMCLRMQCEVCQRRRLCKNPDLMMWACAECRKKYDEDKNDCKHPDRCYCIACLDDDDVISHNARWNWWGAS